MALKLVRPAAKQEDVVHSSMSELILFLLFFFLILLASLPKTDSVGGLRGAESESDLVGNLIERERKMALLEKALADAKGRAGEAERTLSLMRGDRDDAIRASAKMRGALEERDEDLERLYAQLDEFKKGAEEAAAEKHRADTEAKRARIAEEDAKELEENLARLKGELAVSEALRSRYASSFARRGEKIVDLERELAAEKDRHAKAISDGRRLASDSEKKSDAIEDLMRKLGDIRRDALWLKEELRKAEAALDAADRKSVESKWPPLLPLPDRAGYRFKSGEATLTPEFIRTFRSDGLPRLKRILADHPGEITRIDVIGHTDSEFVGNWKCKENLDQHLQAFRHWTYGEGSTPSSQPCPADNAGLGLARAVNVAGLIQRSIRAAWPGVKVYPSSAGQLILVDGRLAPRWPSQRDERSRRRIEIWFRGGG